MKKNIFLPNYIDYIDDKDKPVEQRVRKTKTSFAADHCRLFTQLLQAAAAVWCQDQIPLRNTRFSVRVLLRNVPHLSPQYLEAVFGPTLGQISPTPLPCLFFPLLCSLLFSLFLSLSLVPALHRSGTICVEKLI